LEQENLYCKRHNDLYKQLKLSTSQRRGTEGDPTTGGETHSPATTSVNGQGQRVFFFLPNLRYFSVQWDKARNHSEK
jgi:hypothetical protein